MSEFSSRRRSSKTTNRRIVPGTPFGGYKRSGIGRECGRDTLDQYRQTKAINMRLDEPEL